MSRIVIIGGMGPQASLELHRRIITNAARNGAKDNEDYPEVLHASIPIPDFISNGDSSQGFKHLKPSLDALRFRKDDRIVLACNTAHLLLPEIEASYNIRLISLVETTVQAIKRSGAKRVGLLASPTTIKSGMYEKSLAKIGCEVILPTQSDIGVLEQAIRHVIAGGSPDEVRKPIERLLSNMVTDGAAGVILGCTELSVIFSDASDARVIDPLKLVSEEVLM